MKGILSTLALVLAWTPQAGVVSAMTSSGLASTELAGHAAHGQAAQQTAGPAAGTKQAADPKKKDDDCGCEEKPPAPGVLAVVNGARITSKEIDLKVKPALDNLSVQENEARKGQLDVLINTKLVEQEAKKRGITVAKLIDLEMTSKVKDPTDAEIQAYYDQNKGQINADLQTARASIIGYLRQQRQGEEGTRLLGVLRAKYQVKILAEPAGPPESAEDSALVLATLNGEKVTAGQLEDTLKEILFQVKTEAYNFRQRALDSRINEMLFDAEAAKRKITRAALLAAEVTPKIRPVAESDAADFYTKNRERLQGDYGVLKDRIVLYLQGAERQKAEDQYGSELRKSAAVKTYLYPPPQPFYEIATDDRPARGRADAPVTIVEFTDYQCPTCARFQSIIENLVTEYKDNVRLVVRDFPLDMHQNAFKAAEASEAAREQGKYWEYVLFLFHNQAALEPDKLKEYATQVGLDRARFDAALDSGKFAQNVNRDLKDGAKLGIDSTPTIFVNGHKVRELSEIGLKATVDAELKTAAEKQTAAEKHK